jgi:hypothetical protein
LTVTEEVEQELAIGEDGKIQLLGDPEIVTSPTNAAMIEQSCKQLENMLLGKSR